MSQKVKCPVCGSALQSFSKRHTNSKKHQDALKAAGIDPKDDPSLKMVDKPTTVKKQTIIKKPTVPKPKLPPKTIIKPVVPVKAKKIDLKLGPMKVNLIGALPKVKKEQKPVDALEYATEEDMELDIPAIPEPPKRKELPKLEIPQTTEQHLAKLQAEAPPGVRVILVNCSRCGGVILANITEKIVLNSELPIVEISYVHNNPKGKDLHCLTLQLDHDFDIRRQRISEVIIAK